MEITSDFVKESKILDEGTTCYIMQCGSTSYKLYKGAINYIGQNGEYQLEENETLNRLNYIVSKKNDVTLTDLPSDVLTFNGKAVGIPVMYYNNSISLKDYLIENYSDETLESTKQQVMGIVKELIDNGIVPTDPHFENFLVCYNEDGSYNLRMIDVDDQYVSIYPDNKRDIWYESEVSACYNVIDLSFEALKNSKTM